MIMISPFAFSFIRVHPIFIFSTVLPRLGGSRHFSAHMILPPTLFLKAVRIFALFVSWSAPLSFLPAPSRFTWENIQVGYSVKVSMHNQAPAVHGLGYGHRDDILWPRFIVLASLSIMFILYYFLAKDEEKRMLNSMRFYKDYMNRTGILFLHG